MSRLIVLSNRVMLPSLSNRISWWARCCNRRNTKKSGGIWFGWSREVSKEKEIKPTILLKTT